MKTTTNDPIVAEVREARDKHAAQFDYDIQKIFRNIRDQQQASGRQFVQYPARPAITTSASTES
jgi:hypothetical protein